MLTLDLPGHGATQTPAEPERASMAETAADLDALLEQIVPQQQVDLMGYSMGGRLALFFALNYPDRVRRLVLESASPGLAEPEERHAPDERA